MMALDRILAELGDDDAAALRAALDRGAANTHLVRVLERHGHFISEASIRRWKDSRDHAR